ncbi:hypothetical protein ACHAQA_004783 [Verticillium albo-atrum]
MEGAIFKLRLFILLFAGSTATAFCPPVVDLGYSRHQATYDNKTSLLTFANIKYADAPRFGAPVEVTTTDPDINNGSVVATCPIGIPAWYALSLRYRAGQLTLEDVRAAYRGLQALDPASNSSNPEQFITDPSPTTSEDCLLLDVTVPRNIWGRDLSNSTNSGAPVMVWIVGGGYTVGDKNTAGNPAGLIAKSQEDGSDGVIYVTLNYRLGLFGWSSGPKYQAQGGVSNIGLRDQRFALEWVQKNIHLFGGDPDQVTVFGESAGGGSILHQITARGATSGAPFRQAILQSPGFEPLPSLSKQDARFDNALRWASYFSQANITTLAELAALPFDVLLKVNQITAATAYWSAFGWGPAVDGDFVPDLPGRLLEEGKFDSSVGVFHGVNSNEGFIFTSPLITNDAEYTSEHLENLLPDATEDIIRQVKSEIYPEVYDGTFPWSNQFERTEATVGDSWFSCNNRFVSKAFAKAARGYLFDVGSGYHGTDIAYTYYNEGAEGIDAVIAERLQGYLTAFAKTGDPNTDGNPFIPLYGDDSRILSLTGGTTVKDIGDNHRCTWWQQALYR